MAPNTIAALMMMGSMAAFTLNDTFVKLTDGALPLWQLLFLRGMLAMALIAVLGFGLKIIHFRATPKDWVLIILRSFTEIGAAFFIVSSLLNLPLANVMAVLQVLPLSVSLGAAIFLRETLGWRRLLAIAIGFCGMLLIVRPGVDGFDIWSLYSLTAVFFVTARDLLTRKLSPDAPSMTVTLFSATSLTIVSGILSTQQDWVPVTPALWGLIVGSAVSIFAGYFFSVQVMRQGDIAFVAPFRYTSLIFALLLGWFVFGDWPGLLTQIGALVIVATGVFTFYRERALSRA